jgi:L-aspartate oxidase
MRVTDFLVIGGGVAGLRAATGLAAVGTVLVVTKERLAESNTAYAQGGIAVAMGGDEDVALHLSDTIAAGDGLVDAGAAAVLVAQGPLRVEELLDWGTGFDRQGAGELMRTREGAHSLARILHAHGDGTGREISVSLLRHVRGLERVECMEWATSVDLMVEDGRVVGATLLDAQGELVEVRARAVLVASGGAGQLFSETTNPAVATGDGIAMAYRAGAELMDMEFCQFHPTAFALEGAPHFLMSEALRGEGAWLVNARGERFMQRYHAGLELAPRDVVARAIARERLDGPVYLDMRPVGAQMDLQARFPGISEFLAGYGLELGRDLIPVSPAAHYMMGGVRTDVHGRTSLAGLYAAGEVACTGVHGANRLASNSLLEGLVFGALAAEAMVGELPVADGQLPESAEPTDAMGPHEWGSELTRTGGEEQGVEVERWIAELRGVMWRDAGLLRDGAGLRRAQAALEALRVTMPGGMTRRAVEARNLHLVAEAMVQAALGREESRGAHFRNDFPERGAVGMHSLLLRGELRFID